MRRAQLAALLILALSASGCSWFASRHPSVVDGAKPTASAAVDQRIDVIATDEAALTAATTPAEKKQARARLSADRKAIPLQERAEINAELFHDAMAAIALVCLAVALGYELPVLRLPATIVTLAAGGFAVACITLRTLLPWIPWVVVAGGLAVLVYWYRHRHPDIVAKVRTILRRPAKLAA